MNELGILIVGILVGMLMAFGLVLLFEFYGPSPSVGMALYGLTMKI